MKYRRHSECMTQEEVEVLMGVLLPESQVIELKRLKDSNYIQVTFKLQNREGVLLFHSDHIDNISEWASLENISFYQIYMMANGYSHVWDNKTGMTYEEGVLKTRNNIEEHRRKQLESDSIMQGLLQKSEAELSELLKLFKEDSLKDKLKAYRQINEQIQECREHLGYVRGVSDTVSMLHMTDNRINLGGLPTELEELIEGYNNLHGLIETFGDGTKIQLGDFDITKGIFAIADALHEKNEILAKLFEKVTEEDYRVH